jgi:hypothetical protein
MAEITDEQRAVTAAHARFMAEQSVELRYKVSKMIQGYDAEDDHPDRVADQIIRMVKRSR